MSEGLESTVRREGDGLPDARAQVGSRETRDAVLIVHSYRSLRQAIAHTLQLQGYEVIQTEAPALALAMLGSVAPALLLVEIPFRAHETPGPAAELARTSGSAGIPVIGLASRSPAPGEATPSGIGEVLVMPVAQRELLAVVARTLNSARAATGRDLQCRLPLGDSLRAEHLSLSFLFQAAERIQFRPGNDRQARAFMARLASFGVQPEVEIDGGDLLFRYESSIADALLIDPEGGVDAVQRHILAVFPMLGLRPEPLRQRLEGLAAELRRLQRAAS